jgi:hypothetical protein
MTVARVDILDCFEECSLPSKPSTLFERGDIVYWDETNKYLAPMSAYTWATSDLATQRASARNVFGICDDAKLASDTSYKDLLVITRGRFRIPLDTTTALVEGRTLLAVDGNGATALIDQAVEDVTDPTVATFIAVRTDATASAAECVLYKPDIRRMNLGSIPFTGAVDNMTSLVLGRECTVFKFEALLEVAVTTASWICNLEKNTDDIVGAITIADSVAIGAVVQSATFTPTDFNTTDTLSLETSQAPDTGTASFFISYWQHPSMADLVRMTN